MSRELKFRAYDKRFNVMLADVIPYQPSIIVLDVTFNFSYGDKADERNEIGVDDGGPEHYCITDEQIEIMQFTGLKDKMVVDIYDGDICEVDNNENANHLQTVNCNYAKPLKKGDLLIIKKLLSGFTGQILTNQGEAPNLIGNVSNYSLWNGARQLKVIGNIYQNPELCHNT